MFRRIDRLILRVPSLPAAVAYYRDTLRMKLLRQERSLASFALGEGDSELVLHDDTDQPFEQVYVLVDDVREMHRRREELKLKFVSAPAATSRGYRATVKDPFGTVLLLIDRAKEQSGQSTVEDAKPAGTLFAGVETKSTTKKTQLIGLYESTQLTADDLPYTPQFETLYRSYLEHFDEPKPSRQEVWRQLLNLRKSGKLPKLGEAKSKPPKIAEPARQLLKDMLGADIGRRDRLPYTERFEAMVDAFNKTQPRPLSPHLVWRLVATLAK